MSVLVYTENWDGKLKKLSFELASYASTIANQLSTEVIALSIGDVNDEELSKLATYGVDKILNLNTDDYKEFNAQDYAKAIAEAAKKEQASVAVFANNIQTRAVAPRVTVKLEAGFVSGCVAAPESIAPFIVSKKAFSGKAFAKVKINKDIKILSLNQNAFGIVENPKSVNIEAFDCPTDNSVPKIIEVKKNTGKCRFLMPKY